MKRICRGECGQEKDIEEFSTYKAKNGIIKHRYYCKACDYLRVKEYRKKNPDKHKAQMERHYEKHRNERLRYHEQHYLDHKEERAEYYQENSVEIREKIKKYYDANPGKKQEINQKYFNKRYNTDINFKISHTIGNGIRASLHGNKNGIHWEELVGYTLQQLIHHLESKFDNKMNWGNYGTYWQIDHTVPVNAFNIKSYTDRTFRNCWSLENLQPLDCVSNTQKSDTIHEMWNNVELAQKLLEE
jgi:hypothetical protein